MATHQISILQNATPEDEFVIPSLATNLTAGSLYDPLIWEFAWDTAGTTDHGLYGQFIVPQDYSSAPSIKVHWASTTSQTVIWRFAASSRGNDEESLEQTTHDDDHEATVTSNATTAGFLNIDEITGLVAGDYAAGDLVTFVFERHQSDAADTSAVSAYVFDAVFEYDTA